MSIPKPTKEQRFEKARLRWEQAERGVGGLKRISYYEFNELAADKRRELLTEPTILTSDCVDSLVVMPIEDCLAMMPPYNNPLKIPMMLRQDGKLFRECV